MKIITAKEVCNIVKDGDSLFLSGFVASLCPEEIFKELEKSFLETNSPKNLDLCFAASFGIAKTRTGGLNHFTHKGMIKKVIGGHYGLAPGFSDLIANNDIIAYNYPQGVISQMFRDIGAGKPGTISHVGLGTFVDPDLQGGKLNKDFPMEDMIEKIHLGGKDLLFYKAPTPTIGIIRGTYADKDGNISMDEETLTLETLPIATAVRNAGGKLIVQVKEVVESGVLQPKNVKIPGILVDYVVVAEDKTNHHQTLVEVFNESYVSRKVIEEEKEFIPEPLSERKVIARRSAMLLDQNKKVLNYGIGVPEVIASVLKEEKQESPFIATVEPGAIGGTPGGGLAFGCSSYPHAVIDQPYQFDFYDGGGLDMAFLGLAQCDSNGNINVSKFGPKVAGAGGFINITQNAKEVVFCGAFTAGGLKVEIKDGKLNILQEGKSKKFVKDVEQITFSGDLARKNKKKVSYITERAVFELKEEGLTLTEIAPGVDLEKDILAQMEFKPIISADLKEMDSTIFREEKMGLIIK